MLPTLSKIFERVLCSSIFNYYLNNKLFTSSQLGFAPGDLCIAQLLPIINEIQMVFDTHSGIDMRGFFLDISKAWQKFLIFKSKSYIIEGELLSLLENYLENHEQRIV